MNDKKLEKTEYTLVNGECKQTSERIVKETALTININRQRYATAMILADMEKEFVTGHLFTQGFIQKTANIRSLTINDNTAEVTLADMRKSKPFKEKINSNLKVNIADIFECVKAILKSEIFAETEAVHSAGLFLDGKKTMCIAEDLGRHHALDKVIGYALLHNIFFSQVLVASTGRQPSEMINKCLNVGIPIIVTKGVPTTLAIETAEKAGITIAGLVRGKTMTVYSRPERII